MWADKTPEASEVAGWGYHRAPMLPRSRASARPASSTLPVGPRPLRMMPPRQALPPSLARWLAAPGSLTARLRQHGQVKVQVLSQGRQRLSPQERQALGCAQGHVREVVLHLDGRAAVWARSSTPLRAVKGPWRAIKGLGTRPLAELLFEHQRVVRDALWAAPLHKGAPARQHLARQWAQLTPGAGPTPRWARCSVFWHHGQPLQVQECFAPWVGWLPTRTRGL